MNNSDHAARAKKPVLPPKNRSVARPKNRKQINSIIANTTLLVFKDAMVPKIEKIKKPTKANANCVTSKPFGFQDRRSPFGSTKRRPWRTRINRMHQIQQIRKDYFF